MALDTVVFCSYDTQVFDELDTERFKESKSQPKPENSLIRKERVTTYTHNARSHNSGLGHSGAWISFNQHQVKIECSAKVLGSKYLDGISLNTFEELIHNINASADGAYHLNAKKIYDSCHIEKAHNTFNHVMRKGETLKHIEAILVSCLWAYKKKDDTNISTAQFGTKKEQIQIYDKRLELIENKSPYLKLISPEIDIARFEYKLDSKSKVEEIYDKVISGRKTNLVYLPEILKDENSKKIQLYGLDSLKISKPKPFEESLFNSTIHEMIIKLPPYQIGKSIGLGGAVFMLASTDKDRLKILDDALDKKLDKHDKKLSYAYKSKLRREYIENFENYKKLNSPENYQTYREIAKTFLDELKLAIAI